MFLCEKYVEGLKNNLLAFTFENFTYVNEDFDYSEYRPTEFQILSPDDIKGAALINLRPDVR